MDKGYRRIASAVLIQAVKDLRNSEERNSSLEFFNSQWFTALAEIAEFDGKAISRQVNNGSYNKNVSLRAAYR